MTQPRLPGNGEAVPRRPRRRPNSRPGWYSQRSRVFLSLGSRGAAVPDRLAQAVLAGFRYQRARGRHGTGRLHGWAGVGLGRRRSVRRACYPPGSRVRHSRGRDRPVGAGGASAVARGQGALCVDARRSAGPAGRSRHRPADLLPAGGRSSCWRFPRASWAPRCRC